MTREKHTLEDLDSGVQAVVHISTVEGKTGVVRIELSSTSGGFIRGEDLTILERMGLRLPKEEVEKPPPVVAHVQPQLPSGRGKVPDDLAEVYYHFEGERQDIAKHYGVHPQRVSTWLYPRFKSGEIMKVRG
jgi:hypothetical protein